MPDTRAVGMRQLARSAVRALVAGSVGLLLLCLSRSSLAEAPPFPIRVASDTRTSIVLTFHLTDYTLQQVEGEQGRAFVRVDAPGFAQSVEPGRPELPRTSALIGLPPTGRPAVRILEMERIAVPVSHPIYPVPESVPVYAVTGDPAGTVGYPQDGGVFLPVGLEDTFALDKGVYDGDTLYPANAVDVVDAGWVRDQRVARVSFRPFQYHALRGELEVTRRIVVEIRFEPGPPLLSQDGRGASSVGFDRVLEGVLLNAGTAREWRVRTPVDTSGVEAAGAVTQAGSHKVVVDADGLYQLTYADLQAAGLPVGSLVRGKLQLFEQGQEIDILVEGDPDGILSSGDRVLFYGRVPRSRYTDHNVYWLRYNVAPGARMPSARNVTPGAGVDGVAWATARYEQNRFYDSHVAAFDGDHWYAADVRPGEAHAAVVPLMPLATGVPTATIRAWLAGYTQQKTVDPDHHAVVVVNGQPAGDLVWDGTGAVTGTWTFDRSVLGSGENTVTVSLPGDTGASVEGVWLDALEIGYPLGSVVGDRVTFRGQPGAHFYTLGGFTNASVVLYDVTDAQHPVPLQGAAVTGGAGYTLSFSDAPPAPIDYFACTSAQVRRPVSVLPDVPSNLRAGSNGADYVVVAHADLLSAVQPLVAHRRDQGLAVSVVDVQDVYDEFSGGLLDPEAIREFVAYAYAQWALAPTYVLLVGDGSYDVLDHSGYGSVTYVPPYLDMVDPWWGETAADNRYAAVNGSDPLPDVLLGRLPVSSPAEAAVVVHKILQYEQSPMYGDWNARHVFVADDLDGAGDFYGTLDAVYDAYMTAPWIGDKVYLGVLSAEGAGQQTLNAWQRGALLISFSGHSSWHQWAVESLLDIHDVDDLRNDRRWPVVLSMTCFTGYFQHPEYGTLDEELLRLDGGGAVATWSPSGLGVATGHDVLIQGFYDAVFTDGEGQLGPSILAAKLDLYAQAPEHDDLLDTYHLFGDPAMALNLTIRPWPFSTYLPVDFKNLSGG
jgi:peptidase C25-like protein